MSEAIKSLCMYSILFDWMIKNCTNEEVNRLIMRFLDNPELRKGTIAFLLFNDYCENIENVDEEIRQALEESKP